MTVLLPTIRRRPSTRRVLGGLGVLAAAWVALWLINEHLWGPALGSWLGLDLEGRTTDTVRFFLYDSTKLLLLLTGMVFAIGMLRTSIRPERVRAALEGRSLVIALVLAALLGAVTPFCSCSSVPLFIGFVAAGIPVSVALTFLIASPLINEVAVIVLGSTFGWGVTAAYVVSGLALAVIAGLVLSRFNLRPGIEEFVFESPVAALHLSGRKPTLDDRARAARAEVRSIVGKVWPWVLVGVGVGAAIHGWVPEGFFMRYAGPDNPAAVPIATLVGVPLYSNAATAVPIGQALYAKGVALGTVLSFMMATSALSLPEAILLRRVLKPRLVLAFFGIVTAGIMIIGFVFNWAT